MSYHKRETSSGSSGMQQNSSSEEEIQDERKRKRMESNRESARRSRMRKQKHLDDLTAQVSNFSNINQHIIHHIKLTTQHYIKVESDNCILRAQMSELKSRLESLNEIINVLGSLNYHNYGVGVYGIIDDVIVSQVHDFCPMIQPHPPPSLSNDCFFNHPIMASPSSMFHS